MPVDFARLYTYLARPELATEPAAPASGPRLVTHADAWQRLLPELLAAPVVGLDVETTGLDLRSHRLRLVQLADQGDHAYVIDASAVDVAALAPLLAGKVVISVVVPLQFGRGGPHALRVSEGSAAEEARAIIPDARIASAFHNLSATKLMDVEADLDCDVVVCGDDAEAKQTTIALAEKMQGVRALDGGALAYSRYVEDLTALILAMNRRYKAHASVKFTGL